MIYSAPAWSDATAPASFRLLDMSRNRAAEIRLLVLDVDGVMTDGRLYFAPSGEALKAFHVRDGHGIKELAGAGIEVAVISGRRSAMVSARCRELGVRHVIQGAEDKVVAFQRLCAKLNIDAPECACVADDVPDVPVMKVVGLAFAVADAHRDAIRAAHIVLTTPGGYGAVREVCDFLLDARRDAKKGRQRRILTGPIARSGNAVPNSRVVRSRRVIPKGRRDVTQLAK